MKRWMVVLGIVLVAGGVIGRVWRQSRLGPEVSLAELGRGRVVEAVYATGRVDSERRATVRARTAGVLEELHIGPAQPVARGQRVGRLDAAALRIHRERAEQELEAVRAALNEAEDTAFRTESLVREGLAPEDAGVRFRERARELAAAVRAREAAVALAREQEGWAVLRSPLDGVAADILARPGDPLREGDGIFTVVDLSEAYVRVNVDERDIGRVEVGQEVRLVFDSHPDEVFTGEVWRIVPSVDRLTKASDVLVQHPRGTVRMHLDATVTVNIITRVVEDALLVSRDALEGHGAVRRVWQVDDDGHAVPRTIRVGACDERACEITEGLAVGDTVIDPLPAGLREGQRVRVP